MSLTPTDLLATADPAVFTVPETYVAGTLVVLVDGVVQEPVAVYTVSGLDVTFLVAPSGWVAGTWVASPALTPGHYLTAGLLQARVGGLARYLRLTDDDGDSVPDSSVEEEVLTQVDLLVDSFVRRGGYVTPLLTGDVQSILPFLLDVANYRLQTRAGGMASEGDRKLYDDAMSLLDRLGTGDFELPSYQSKAPIENFGMDTGSSTQGVLFSRETLRGF